MLLPWQLAVISRLSLPRPATHHANRTRPPALPVPARSQCSSTEGAVGPVPCPATAVAPAVTPPLGQVMDVTHCSLFFASDSALSICPAFVLRHPAELRSSGCDVTSGTCQEHPTGRHCVVLPAGHLQGQAALSPVFSFTRW